VFVVDDRGGLEVVAVEQRLSQNVCGFGVGRALV
jgi:hypothetical protein